MRTTKPSAKKCVFKRHFANSVSTFNTPSQPIGFFVVHSFSQARDFQKDDQDNDIFPIKHRMMMVIMLAAGPSVLRNFKRDGIPRFFRTGLA